MGVEIDLLAKYPKSNRNVDERGLEKTDKDREIARRFGKEFFDGDRRNGYGGFNYNSKFWEPVVPDFQKHFSLNSKSSVLDVGCAKGFMIYDFSRLIAGITVKGIDISDYAIENAIVEVKERVQVADAKNLPFEDNSFDVVISINTVHNLEIEDCGKALQEIERVSRGKSFITVDAFRNEQEKERMFAWNLTGRTIMSTQDWIIFFDKVGYTGDYYWFIP